ncbi:MAG: polysaccharide biosynthesis protein [Bacteroidetes bacterium B1(2017)]|nr:MAG: polysaccharide biosynthesis protein [Bacteroidetes bacterium B1(2017)]
MSTLKKLAGQTAIYGLSTIAGRFFYFLLVPFYTRIFTQGEYGINSEFYAYISFFNIILTHGMETSFFRFATKENSKQVFANALVSVVGVSAIFAVLFLGFGAQLANGIGYGDHPEYIYYSVGILVFDSLAAIPFALLRYESRPLRFAIIKNLNILTIISLNLYFLWLGPYWQANYGVLLPFYHEGMGIDSIFLANLVASILTVVLLSKELTGIGFGFEYTQWRLMISYAFPLIGVGLAGMVNETLDRAILRYVWPDKAEAQAMNGVYAANYKLSIIITLFIQAYKFAAEPFFFNHSKTTEKRDLYATVMNYFVWICLFVFLLVMLFLHYFKGFIGPEFHEGLKVVPILLFANIFLGIYYNVSIWYKLSDHTKKGALISVYGAIITIGLNLLLIPKLGYVGCAWTTFACYLFMMILGYAWGQKYYPIPYNLARAASYLVLALLFYGIGMVSENYLEVGGLTSNLLRGLLLAIFVFVGYTFERKQTLLIFKK